MPRMVSIVAVVVSALAVSGRPATLPLRNAQGAVAPRSRGLNARAMKPLSRARLGGPIALPKPRIGPMYAQRKASQVERTIDAWKQAGASAALGLFIALGANLGPGASLALAADSGKAITEQINMDALKEMTKDAMQKGYDQKWIDDHLAQMEARGYDIEWVQEHLGTVMDDMKKKAEVDPNNMMFKNLNEGKSPEKLESERVVSSIPRTSVDGLPSHQEGLEGIDQWVYPSPKMFWNAMDRKGKHPERYNPEDISGVVRIHNFVNEKAWNEILKWEDMHKSECPSGPSLTSFKGKYDKLSGKGFLNKYVPLPGSLGAPFDRHDWVINRCGKTVRYVLDYYKDQNMQEEPKIRLDVRPAPDSVDNLMDWMRYGSYEKEIAKNAKVVTFEQTTQMKTANQVLKELNEGGVEAAKPTSS